MNRMLCMVLIAVLASAGFSTADGLGKLAVAPLQKNPSARAAEYGQYSTWFFAFTEIDAKGDVLKPKPAEPLRYLKDQDLSGEARRQLAQVRPGVSRESLEKTWVETGGLIPCQFVLLEKDRGPEYVAVRIEWRPSAMPERVYADKNLRHRWLERHVPMPAPDDVAVRVSRPYLAKCVID